MVHRASRRKNISGALLFSLIFHAILMVALGFYYLRTQLHVEEASLQVEVIEDQRRTPSKSIKRPLFLAPLPRVADANVHEIDHAAFATRPVFAHAPTVPQLTHAVETHLPTLREQTSPLAEAHDSTSAEFIGLSQLEGGQDAAGTTSERYVPRYQLHQKASLGLEHHTSAPDLGGFTKPDLALTKIARHILLGQRGNKIDIVFIIDASQSMRNDIDAVRNHLTQMTDLLHADQLDFTVGVVAFRDVPLAWDFQVTPQTSSISAIKDTLDKISCRGGEKASNALMRAANVVQFRNGAARRFILVTDEYVSGDYSLKEILTKMESAQIRVDVIGREQTFQQLLAERTGGLWLPIASLKE